MALIFQFQDLEEAKKLHGQTNDYFDGVILFFTDMYINLIFRSCCTYTL